MTDRQLLALALTSGLLTGCGSGLAGILSTSDSASSSSNAPPVLSGLAVVDPNTGGPPKTSPARVRFVVADRESDRTDVTLTYRIGSGAEQPLAAISGDFSGNPAGLDTSRDGIEYAIDWSFTAEGDPELDGSYVPDVVVRAMVDGGVQEQALGANGELGLGNDAPVVHAIEPMPTDPSDPDESSGNVELRLRISDTSADVVDVRVEWRRANDAPDAWQPATAAGVFPDGIETQQDPGVELSFFWNTNVDLAGEETEVLFRVTADDRTASQVFETLSSFRIDNNAPPLASLPFVTTVADTRRGIPIPFKVFDTESDPVRLIFQWGKANESFPELPGDLDSLLSALEDPAQRKALQIATELPLTFEGRPAAPRTGTPVANRLCLPELAGPASPVVTRGIVGRELSILRPRVPTVLEPGPDPLEQPIAALAVGDGRDALVLDGTAQGWRLREIELATGTVVEDVAAGSGVAAAMSFEPGASSVLVASSPSANETDWRIDRIDRSASPATVTTLIELQRGTPAKLRDIASLGSAASLITLGNTLVRLSYPPQETATSSVLLDGLGKPWGLALDPLHPDRVFVAENRRDRVLALDLVTLIARPVVATGIGFPRPQSIALERSGARLLAVTQQNPNGTRELRSVDLGGAGGNAVAQVFPQELGAPGFLGRVGDLTVGPDGLRLLALTGANRLAVGGGVEQRRVVVGYDAPTRTVTCDRDFDPVLDARAASTRTWRIPLFVDLEASPDGVFGVFLWDSSDLPLGGEPVFRVIPLDTDIGVDDIGTPKSVTAPQQTEPLELGLGGWMVTADVDGDGRLDLVTSGPTVSFQTAPGVFDPPLSVGVGGLGVAAADLDGDGRVDLATANQLDRNLEVYFQQADGSFPATPLVLDVPLEFATTFPSSGPRSIAAADLDGNGYLDLVCGNQGAGIVPIAVYFQTSARVFDPTPLKRGEPAPMFWSLSTAVIAADLDGDGHVDIVTLNNRNVPGSTDSLDVYFQTGPGAFTDTPLVLGAQASSSPALATSDLDGDGDLDLMAAMSGRLNVFFQTGPRVFGTAMPIADSDQSFLLISVTAADVDADGDNDLAAVTLTPDAEVIVFLQTSPGIFASNALELAGASTSAGHTIAVADLNGDGALDLASSRGAIFFQSRPGGRYAPTVPPSGCGPESSGVNDVAIGDLDGDGDLDFVAADGRLAVGFQTSPGELAGGFLLSIAVDTFTDVTAVDLDGDVDLDVVAVDSATAEGGLKVYFQTSPGQFASPLALGDPATLRSPASVVAADLDGDGDLDLATIDTVGTNLAVFFQDAGTFAPVPLVLGGPGITDGASTLAAADLDGDGAVDLVSANRDPRALTIFFQNELGELEATPLVLGDAGPTPFASPVAVAVGDLDGDGAPDLVAVTEEVVVFFQTSPRQYAAPVVVDVDTPFGGVLGVTLVDLDRDTDLDLVVGRFQAFVGPWPPVALFQTGRGRFEQAPLPFAEPNSASCALYPADMDGDGDLDLMTRHLYVMFGGI